MKPININRVDNPAVDDDDSDADDDSDQHEGVDAGNQEIENKSYIRRLSELFDARPARLSFNRMALEGETDERAAVGGGEVVASSTTLPKLGVAALIPAPRVNTEFTQLACSDTPVMVPSSSPRLTGPRRQGSISLAMHIGDQRAQTLTEDEKERAKKLMRYVCALSR